MDTLSAPCIDDMILEDQIIIRLEDSKPKKVIKEKIHFLPLIKNIIKWIKIILVMHMIEKVKKQTICRACAGALAWVVTNLFSFMNIGNSAAWQRNNRWHWEVRNCQVYANSKNMIFVKNITIVERSVNDFPLVQGKAFWLLHK